MLTIKDLTLDKELDAKEMTAVRGGTKFEFKDVNNSGNAQLGDGNLGIVGDGNVVGDNNKVANDSFNDHYHHHHYHHCKWY